MKVYLTKYALSDGIKEIEAERGVSAADGLITWEKHGYSQYAHKGEWFRTLEEAVADAEERRFKKLASLKKQIEKLRKLTFSATEQMERT